MWSLFKSRTQSDESVAARRSPQGRRSHIEQLETRLMMAGALAVGEGIEIVEIARPVIGGTQYVTYDLRITSLTDWTNQRLDLTLTSGTIFQHAFGGNTPPTAPALALDPDVQWDTYFSSVNGNDPSFLTPAITATGLGVSWFDTLNVGAVNDARVARITMTVDAVGSFTGRWFNVGEAGIAKHYAGSFVIDGGSGETTLGDAAPAEIGITDDAGAAGDLTLELGGKPIGQSVKKTFTITNSGNEDLDISNLAKGGAAAADFTYVVKRAGGTVVTGDSFAIPPLASYTIEVTFVPSATGDRIAQITFDTNDPDDAEGAITLNLIGQGRPANDDLSGAVSLSGATASAAGTNQLATSQTGEPAHGGQPAGASVWWRWTASATGTVTVDTIGSSFDTMLAAYSGSSFATLQAKGADDNSGGGTASRVTFTAVQGSAYYFAVTGVGAAAGDIALNVSLDSDVIMVGDGHAGKVAFVDADGSTVVIALKGGVGVVRMAGLNITQTSTASGIVLSGLGLKLDNLDLLGGSTKGSLTITTKGGTLPGAIVGSITGNASLAKLTAATTTFDGSGIVIGGAGTIASVTVGGLDSGADIVLPGAGPAATLSLGMVSDGSDVTVASAIKSLKAVKWAGGQLTAPTVGALSVTGSRTVMGDMGASVALGGVDAKGLSLGSAKIAGSVTSSTWVLAGNAGAMSFFSTSGWQLTGGYIKSLATKDAMFGTIEVGAIGSVAAKGNIAGTITLTGVAGTTDYSLGKLSAARADGLTLLADAGIKSISVLAWGSGELAADYLGSLGVKGDTRVAIAGNLGADITLRGGLMVNALASVKVAGQITGGTWTVTGNVGKIAAGTTSAAWTSVVSGSVAGVSAKTVLAGQMQAASVAKVSGTDTTGFIVTIV